MGKKAVRQDLILKGINPHTAIIGVDGLFTAPPSPLEMSSEGQEKEAIPVLFTASRNALRMIEAPVVSVFPLSTTFSATPTVVEDPPFEVPVILGVAIKEVEVIVETAGAVDTLEVVASPPVTLVDVPAPKVRKTKGSTKKVALLAKEAEASLK